MSDDELKLVTISALTTLFTTTSTKSVIVQLPLSSMDLLTQVMTTKIPAGLLLHRSTPPRFRLTDLKRFERILEDLARTWEGGRISYSRERNGEMTVWEVVLGVKAFGLTAVQDKSAIGEMVSRKRKRVVDEEADSAAGDEYEDEDDVIGGGGGRGGGASQAIVGVGVGFAGVGGAGSATSNLRSLSKELREVYAILQRSTAKGRLLAEQFHSQEDTFEPICQYITKDDCAKARRAAPLSSSSSACQSIHFRPLIRPHTDITLGHCSYLNTCYSEPTYAQSPSIPPFSGTNPGAGGHGRGGSIGGAGGGGGGNNAGLGLGLGVGMGMNLNTNNARGPVSLPSGLGAGGRGKEKAPCRYLHYEVDWDGSGGEAEVEREKERERERERRVAKKSFKLGVGMGPMGKESKMLPPQWINCDLRRFDYTVLGKFHVIMADPPWDIHMSLPYGTMTDDEMRAMPIPALQDEGLLFLWVTGRAMEVGRECLRVWGYTRVDEVVWVKTNQLQRVIRTGRTGHWLNHTKEHMLVGVKTRSPPPTSITDPGSDTLPVAFPPWVNRGLDTDVIVSEVRETSRKPDEVYGLIERMCPGGRKVEIFGRRHNARPGWLTLGNQLGGVDVIWEEELRERVKERYPERAVQGGEEEGVVV